jgi:hypothetical protein
MFRPDRRAANAVIRVSKERFPQADNCGLKDHRREAGGFDNRLQARLVWVQQKSRTKPFAYSDESRFPRPLRSAKLSPTYWKWSPEGEGF